MIQFNGFVCEEEHFFVVVDLNISNLFRQRILIANDMDNFPGMG